MDSAAPMAGKRRGFRRWRLATLLLLASPIVALLLGNLVLSTPWVCHWTAARIQRHTGGLDVSVSGVTFTPWSGISISGLELLQPVPLRAAMTEPLLHIDSLRIAPVWQAWLRGKIAVHSMELDTPRIVMPVELLAQLTKALPTAQPIPQPTAAAQVAQSTTATPPATPPVMAPSVTAPTHAQPPIPTALPSIPTGWFHLKNASFTLLQAESKRVLLEISNTRGAIPISGNPANSHITMGSISILGQPVASLLSAGLEWKSSQLSLKPLEVNIGGNPFLIAAQLGSFSGLPLQIEAKLPPHRLAPLAIPFGGQIEAESITAATRFRGLLLAPATWQGDLVIESTSPSVHLASHDAKFDRGNAVTVLRGGILSCVDARLIGDELSLLGNATLLADGRLAGAARIVAAPGTLTSIASQTFPLVKEAPILTPLSTPQRSAFDLEASGTIHQIFLRVGKDGPIVEFKP
jgi:hypothetical protein